MKILENYSLKQLNSFGVDIKTRYYIKISDFADLPKIYNFIYKNDLNYFILGDGSNSLFINNFNGIVLHMKKSGYKIEETSQNWKITAYGGQNWDNLVQASVEHGIIGLENLSYIPGSVGAAPVQNIGAYGAELSDFLKECEIFDLRTGDIRSMDSSECRFSYRESVFKNELKNRVVILSVKLEIAKSRKLNFAYEGIEKYIKNNNLTVSNSAQLREVIIAVRNSKIPMPSKFKNAGSFFKNPIINKTTVDKIKSLYRDVPIYILGNENFKIPAGWLIEICGLKGIRIGDVGTFEKQALVIVNYGNASGQEIYNFALDIQTKVYEEFGIFLEPEVNIIK
ncbi:MAG: UDP-N-acetylmuramate dehydrogenase [Melioribacteraceae bacterium]|nr:UDP-N-acetylmuramate dehydrogenase [Melioribacteraceae bacterium]MCO6472423.1 UDP-N-acetylmuramate dehydrogenase [Melioribacteraceae bacterium]MDD3558651.1 UDP-N-acetylmuramate dehydrogenase [Melioribacteraceae bacterium]